MKKILLSLCFLIFIFNNNIYAKGVGEIEGPYNKGDPVHEILTSHALNKYKSSAFKKDFKKYKPSNYEYIRGVIWNDDPQALFFNTDSNSNSNWSSGVIWLQEYCGAFKSTLDNEKLIFDAKDLTKRSHFGDLQFFHAMASVDGETASTTKNNIFNWLSFLYLVIDSEEITKNTEISKITHPIVNQYFSQSNGLTMKELFGAKGYSNINIKKRAIGSFLHVIQDSYFPGHVSRKNVGGEIKEFLSYSNQDVKAHGNKDTWDVSYKDRVMHGNSNSYLVQTLPQYERIIQVTNKLLQKINPENKKDRKSWEEIQQYLDANVFNTISKPNDSSSGQKFKLKKKKKLPYYCI